MSRSFASPLQRPGALLFLWLGRTVAALLIALPVAGALSVPLDRFPQGDRLLFVPGATYLVEVLRVHALQVAAALHTSGWLLLVLGFAQLVPIGALMAALVSPERPRLVDLLLCGARHLPAFGLLGGVTVLAQAIVLVAAIPLAVMLRSALRFRLGPMGADLVTLSAMVVALLLAGLIGVIQDLGRSAVVMGNGDLVAALRRALWTFRARSLRVTFDWATRGAAAAAALGAGQTLAIALGPDRPGIGRFSAILASHQLAILTAVYLRASWLRAALEHVNCLSPQSLVDRAERSDAPDDPTLGPDASRDAGASPTRDGRTPQRLAGPPPSEPTE